MCPVVLIQISNHGGPSAAFGRNQNNVPPMSLPNGSETAEDAKARRDRRAEGGLHHSPRFFAVLGELCGHKKADATEKVLFSRRENLDRKTRCYAIAIEDVAYPGTIAPALCPGVPGMSNHGEHEDELIQPRTVAYRSGRAKQEILP